MRTIAVLGMGKVGSLVGVLLSDRFQVTGFDVKKPHYQYPLPFKVKEKDLAN